MKFEGYVMGSSQTKPLVEIDDNVVLDPVVNQDHPNFDYKKQLIDNDTHYKNNHKLILEHYQEV